MSTGQESPPPSVISGSGPPPILPQNTDGGGTTQQQPILNSELTPTKFGSTSGRGEGGFAKNRPHHARSSSSFQNSSFGNGSGIQGSSPTSRIEQSQDDLDVTISKNQRAQKPPPTSTKSRLTPQQISNDYYQLQHTMISQKEYDTALLKKSIQHEVYFIRSPVKFKLTTESKSSKKSKSKSFINYKCTIIPQSEITQHQEDGTTVYKLIEHVDSTKVLINTSPNFTSKATTPSPPQKPQLTIHHATNPVGRILNNNDRKNKPQRKNNNGDTQQQSNESNTNNNGNNNNNQLKPPPDDQTQQQIDIAQPQPSESTSSSELSPPLPDEQQTDEEIEANKQSVDFTEDEYLHHNQQQQKGQKGQHQDRRRGPSPKHPEKSKVSFDPDEYFTNNVVTLQEYEMAINQLKSYNATPAQRDKFDEMVMSQINQYKHNAFQKNPKKYFNNIISTVYRSKNNKPQPNLNTSNDPSTSQQSTSSTATATVLNNNNNILNKLQII